MPPRIARLLAALVAIALIAGAFAIRGAISGDDDGEDTKVDMPTDPDIPDDSEASDHRLACDQDLADVCEALGVDPVRASDLLGAEGDLPYDAWLTLDPMGGVLDSTRLDDGGDAVTAGRVEVASSTLALLALEDPPGGCGDDTSVEWSCLMDPPEVLRAGVAVPSPDTSLGTLALAAAATAAHGSPDYDRSDFEGTAAADAVTALLRDSPSGVGSATAGQTSALFNPGTADAAVTYGGLAQLRADTVRGGNRGMRVLTLTPEVTVGVVLVGLGPDGEAAVRALEPVVTGQTVRDALADSGWAGGAAATSGLPEAEFIYGVREELG